MKKCSLLSCQSLISIAVLIATNFTGLKSGRVSSVLASTVKYLSRKALNAHKSKHNYNKLHSNSKIPFNYTRFSNNNN